MLLLLPFVESVPLELVEVSWSALALLERKGWSCFPMSSIVAFEMETTSLPLFANCWQGLFWLDYQLAHSRLGCWLELDLLQGSEKQLFIEFVAATI